MFPPIGGGCTSSVGPWRCWGSWKRPDRMRPAAVRRCQQRRLARDLTESNRPAFRHPIFSISGYCPAWLDARP
jgi:hypothetical protein